MHVNLFGNMGEYVKMTFAGFDSLPIYFGILSDSFFALYMGFFVGLMYVFSLILVGALIAFRKAQTEDLLVMVLSIYGLCLYHYFVFRSSPVSYHAMATPFSLILCFWLNKFLLGVNAQTRQRALIAITGVMLFALVTSHVFIRYPNFFNLSGRDFEKEKISLNLTFSIDEDADMIRALTKADEKVCLISTFETAILMKADRQPFFYYFPLLEPRLLTMKDFGGTKLLTLHQLQDLVGQMERQKPSLIFAERKLILGEIPRIYYERYISLTVLVGYIRSHYNPIGKGKYLLALKRIPGI